MTTCIDLYTLTYDVIIWCEYIYIYIFITTWYTTVCVMSCVRVCELPHKRSEAVHCPSLVGWSRLPWHRGVCRSSGLDGVWTLASWSTAAPSCDRWLLVTVGSPGNPSTRNLKNWSPEYPWMPFLNGHIWRCFARIWTQFPDSQGLVVPLTSIVSPVQRNWRSGLQPLTAAVRMWWCSATVCRAFSAF